MLLIAKPPVKDDPLQSLQDGRCLPHFLWTGQSKAQNKAGAGSQPLPLLWLLAQQTALLGTQEVLASQNSAASFWLKLIFNKRNIKMSQGGLHLVCFI